MTNSNLQGVYVILFLSFQTMTFCDTKKKKNQIEYITSHFPENMASGKPTIAFGRLPLQFSSVFVSLKYCIYLIFFNSV